MLTLTEYKQLTQYIAQLTQRKNEATDRKHKIYLTKRIKQLNARIALDMQNREV